MNMLKIAARNISRNRRRSILSGLAIVFSVFAIVFLFGMQHGFTDALHSNVQNFISGELRVRHAEFDTYEHLSPLHLAVGDATELRERVAAHPTVRSAVVRIPFGGVYFQDNNTFSVQLLAADFAQEEGYMGISDLLMAGRLPTPGTNEAVVGVHFLERFGLAVGDQMTVLVTTFVRGSNAFTVKLVGVLDFPYAALSRNTIMLSLGQAQRYLRAGSAATEILIKLNPGYPYQQARAALTEHIDNDELVVTHWSEVSTAAGFVRRTQVGYTVIAFVLLLLASTVIINTTIMVIYERIREIGMLGAIGMSGRNIVLLFYLEALCIAVIAALVGIVLGSVLNGYFGYAGLDLGSQVGDIQISSVIYTRTSLSTIGLVFLYAVLVSGLTTLIPAIRCAKIKPVEALREE